MRALTPGSDNLAGFLDWASPPRFDLPRVRFVGATSASSPASTTTGAGVNTITIPVPSGVADGDLLVAVICPNATAGLIPPSGWTIWLDHANTNTPKMGVYYRYASSEPASYDWTIVTATRLSGNMIAFRNGVPGYLVCQANPSSPGDHNPVFTPAMAGAALLTGIARVPGTLTPAAPTEDFSATSPLTLAEQHIYTDGSTDAQSVGTAIAYELTLGASSTISGRHMTCADGPNSTGTRLLTIVIRARTGPVPVNPTIVGSSKATTPATTTLDVGTAITIPVPSGVVENDHLLAVTFVESGLMTTPSGWSQIMSSSVCQIWYRKAGSSEPADYTWTATSSAQARSGCMIAIHGGNIAFNLGTGSGVGSEVQITGSAISNSGSGMGVPTLVNRAQAGSIMIALMGRQELDNDEDVSTSAGHTLQIQHVSGVAGVVARCTAISAKTGITAHTSVSGLTFVDAETGASRIAAIMIDPI